MHCRALPLWLGSAAIAAGLALLPLDEGLARPQDDPADTTRPRLVLRARPAVGLSPARIVMSGELLGGSGDLEEYYCPRLEWDWGDDTVSESSSDCDPYDAGTSEVRRRFTVEHVFRRAGTYRVYLRLKQQDRIVAAASTTVTIRPRPGEIVD